MSATLEPPADDDPAQTQTHRPLGMIGGGGVIGPYRLLERLGEGGMGEVWLAEQTRPIRRQLALKIIKAGMDTAQVVARFEAERQALALMDHPAIARVFDAGATELGRPYFAMEWVRGESLAAYCDRQRLTIRQRLELLIHVCEGVQHAHQKGIIHRDLKPSNILVTVQDDRPVPKIIDFGIAKAMSHSLTEHTLYTSLVGFVGTPEYMSPEQAEMGGADIDTRTDVYALGVILYQLLTGQLPFDLGTPQEKSIDEIRRIIRQGDAIRPSTRVTQLGVSAADLAQKRQLDPSRLRSSLRGDLDWITMRALEKDRSRRYGSASDLAEDIRRHLTHQPVLAGPPTASYRAHKFVRRHRLAVAASMAALLLLISFSAGIALQTQRIARERDRANSEARRANLEADTARQVSEFLVSLFKVSDPGEARGDTLTAREILDNGAREIEHGLASEPEVQARLQRVMGIVYTGLGAYPAAEQLLRRAVENSHRLFGDSHTESLNAVHALANVYWFQERFAEAEPLYLKVIRIREQNLGMHHRSTMRAQYDLASLYAAQGRVQQAEPLMREVFERQRRVLGEEDEDTLDSIGNLASLYYLQKRYAEAEPISARVLDLKRRKWGDDHPETLLSMHNLATVLDRLERWDQAEQLYIQTISAKRRVLGELHDSTVLSIRRLCAMYRRATRLSDAERHLVRTATALAKAPGADPRVVRTVLDDLVALYDDSGKPARAAQWRAKLTSRLSDKK